jgi:hypothetical protein
MFPDKFTFFEKGESDEKNDDESGDLAAACGAGHAFCHWFQAKGQCYSHVRREFRGDADNSSNGKVACRGGDES